MSNPIEEYRRQKEQKAAEEDLDRTNNNSYYRAKNLFRETGLLELLEFAKDSPDIRGELTLYANNSAGEAVPIGPDEFLHQGRYGLITIRCQGYSNDKGIIAVIGYELRWKKSISTTSVGGELASGDSQSEYQSFRVEFRGSGKPNDVIIFYNGARSTPVRRWKWEEDKAILEETLSYCIEHPIVKSS